MNITSTKPVAARAATQAAAPEKTAQKEDGRGVGERIVDFYESNKTPIHIAGGALLGAGLASYGAGLAGSEVLSAAGSGALGGFFAGNSSQRALAMGGGAALGATIAGMAGLSGVAMMSAAGTGTLIGFLVG